MIWTTAGTYRLDTPAGSEVDVLAGARLLDMRQTLAWQFSGNLAGLPLARPGGSVDVDIRHWDGAVGAKGRVDIGSGWFLPFHADVGTGDSDFIWQLLAGLGYCLPAGQLIAAWRHLEYRPKDGAAFDKVSLGGPSIGFVMRW